jgi:3-methylcrotonyl-CoA carboxylase alpha subunit
MARIDSLLVANRGEIAVRIFRTCRRLGVQTIAVYTSADARALHVVEADEAVSIDSYLNAAAIIGAAKSTRAAAIHPGYGFLAENPDFAHAVIEADLIWVGPPPAAMRTLGDKAHAKALAEQHNVPLLPGYHGADQSPEVLQEHASRIGYPVLIKASAGGGGRGMRVVEAGHDFHEALQAARREALSSFGDDRVLLERYVRRPRHVEIQILGDQHGHLVHLGERECSIQRRHQKLIEESPSPAVDADLRARMGDAALRLARAAGYTNAGTVEFLLEGNGQFAFLEVNARLQVEHPVTEAVTGLDLVELQLNVASGEPLPLTQGDVKFDGHAIEVRVIAEDPLSGFLPSSGTIDRFTHPSFVRVDTWITDGTVVSPLYDSLLAKVIAHDIDRGAAARRLAHALQEVWIDGVAENVDLLLATIEHPAFLNGDLHTGFLEDHQVVEGLAEVPAQVMAAVSALDFLTPGEEEDPWRASTAWRIARLDQPAEWMRSGRRHAASVSSALDDDSLRITTGEQMLNVRLLGRPPSALRRVSVEGQAVIVFDDDRDRRVVEWQGRGYRFRRPPPLNVYDVAREHAGGAVGRLTAPMPGRIVKISVANGEHVTQNQPLVVLEAMKMEHVVEAPHAGVVTEVCVEVGEQVRNGAQLLTLGSVDEHRTVE